jgi:hypothetical protein
MEWREMEKDLEQSSFLGFSPSDFQNQHISFWGSLTSNTQWADKNVLKQGHYLPRTLARTNPHWVAHPCYSNTKNRNPWGKKVEKASLAPSPAESLGSSSGPASPWGTAGMTCRARPLHPSGQALWTWVPSTAASYAEPAGALAAGPRNDRAFSSGSWVLPRKEYSRPRTKRLSFRQESQ